MDEEITLWELSYYAKHVGFKFNSPYPQLSFHFSFLSFCSPFPGLLRDSWLKEVIIFFSFLHIPFSVPSQMWMSVRRTTLVTPMPIVPTQWEALSVPVMMATQVMVSVVKVRADFHLI